jgi:hypothetical protein
MASEKISLEEATELFLGKAGAKNFRAMEEEKRTNAARWDKQDKNVLTGRPVCFDDAKGKLPGRNSRRSRY